MRRPLQFCQPTGDLGDPILNLDRRVIPHPDRQQPQRPVTELRRLDRRGRPERSFGELVRPAHAQSVAPETPLPDPAPSRARRRRVGEPSVTTSEFCFHLRIIPTPPDGFLEPPFQTGFAGKQPF